MKIKSNGEGNNIVIIGDRVYYDYKVNQRIPNRTWASVTNGGWHGPRIPNKLIKWTGCGINLEKRDIL